jgi:hypothetical protein
VMQAVAPGRHGRPSPCPQSGNTKRRKDCHLRSISNVQFHGSCTLLWLSRLLGRRRCPPCVKLPIAMVMSQFEISGAVMPLV